MPTSPPPARRTPQRTPRRSPATATGWMRSSTPSSSASISWADDGPRPGGTPVSCSAKVRSGTAVALALLAVAGCQRAAPEPAAQDQCSPSEGLPLVSTPDTPAIRSGPQSNGWTLAPGIPADDAECAALQPGVPTDLSFSFPSDRFCSDLFANPQSALAVRTGVGESNVGPLSFF